MAVQLRMHSAAGYDLEQLFSNSEMRAKSHEAQRRNAAEEKLKENRRKYLQHEILQKEMYDLVNCSSGESAALAAGSRLPASSAKTMTKRMQVARAMQQLLLPQVEGTQVTPNKPVIGKEADAGSLDHVLGVDGDALVQLHLKSDKNEQSLIDDVTEVLGQRLEARAGSMRAAVGAACSTSTSASLSSSERIACHSHALHESQGETLESLQRLLEGAMRCATLLNEVHAIMASFIQHNLLERQLTLDQFNVELNVAHCRSLAHKLGIVKKQLQAATYTRDNVAALAVLATHIRTALLQTQASLSQVLKELSVYHQLGPQFEAVVAEYGRLKADIVQAQARLDIFNQMENELPRGY